MHAGKSLPENTLALLKQLNLKTVMQNMKMTAELIRVMNLLKENGIQALAFKGPALSQLAYEDITLRQYGDLDILVKKMDASKAISLLTEDQYTPEISLKEKTTETFFACVNVIGMEKRIRIEIHWELLSRNYAIEWQEKDIWRATDTVIIKGEPIPVLAANTHLLYLIAHGSKHLFERLEWICDIERFIKANPGLSWERLFEDARVLGIERMLLTSLYLCNRLLELTLPAKINDMVLNDSMAAELGQSIIDLHYSEQLKEKRNDNRFKLLWRMRDNHLDRLRFAYRALFTPKFDDFKYIELPRSLVFLYPVIRPIRLITKNL